MATTEQAMTGRQDPVKWLALYPIVMLAVVPIAIWWGLSDTIGPGLVILLQGLLWLGFAVIVYASRAKA